jgi:TolB-like protein
MSGDPEQEYFADGIVEEITTAIARLPWLFVIARNSSFTYKGKAINVKQVARELGVRYVLEGSVRKAGNRVRITGQLIDATTGSHIWADRFDGALDDIFDLQKSGGIKRSRRDRAAPAAVGNRARRAQADRKPRRLRSLSARAGANVSLHRGEPWRGGRLRQALAIPIGPNFAAPMALHKRLGVRRLIGRSAWRQTMPVEDAYRKPMLRDLNRRRSVFGLSAGAMSSIAHRASASA